MDTQRLHHFLARVPGTAGDHLGRRMAVNMLEAGRAVGAGVLVEMVGPDVLPALVAAGAPASALRAAIDAAVVARHRELPGTIVRNGGRAVFADWCRQAGYVAPQEWPGTVGLYRGTLGCNPAEAAAGLHWTTRFDDAAFYAARFADEHLTGAIVLHARVPRSEIACVIAGSAHEEVVPADVPTSFDVISDKARIGDAAVRNVERMNDMKAGGGWYEADTGGMSKRVAMAARARMAAIEVPPGASIAR